MRQVHQFHGVVAYGDAIGNDILNLQKMLHNLGYASEVFASYPQRAFESPTHHWHKHRKWSSPANVLLCHFSIGYPPEVLHWLRALPDRKVLIYHNITPAPYFAGINDIFFEETHIGRQQLAQLLPLTAAGWGDSDFNRQELVTIGWQQTAVLPIVFEPRLYQLAPDRATLDRSNRDRMLNVLFVSRLVPNKKFEDVILTFYHLKKFIEPRARLYLVGSPDHMEKYATYLQALVARLALTDVHFIGHVSREELIAYYRAADVYLCLSEHEGFGVPLIESMYFDVPVIAYAAAAVPETMGGAGVLVTRKDHAAIAELINRVARDESLRARLIARQRQRWPQFTPTALLPTLRACLEAIR
jgi:L-malate glycosyltransferase